MTAILRPGDCRDVMLDMLMDGEQFDSIITDPPYELTSIAARFGKPDSAPAAPGVYGRSSGGFMGKQWDATGISYNPDMWRQAYSLLRPGGYIAAFGGTRTYHRIACAIEDAGFELRDTLMWMFGTGFPKSHDVSKGIDKQAGAVRPVVGSKLGRPGMAKDGSNQRSGFDDAFGGESSGVLSSDITAPATAEAVAWSGWGTALKPAYEPIILARKPLNGTVAQNVLLHGCGAMNVDACRVALPDGDPLHNGISGRDGATMDETGGWGFKAVDRVAGLGRWPANVVHDGSPEVLEAFARFGAAPGQQGRARTDGSPSANVVYSALRNVTLQPDPRGDSGTAARFFPCCPWSNDDLRFHYSGKANKAERWEHCKVCGTSHPARERAEHKHGLETNDHLTSHPTVKPLALMRWLATLLTRPSGRILDPFAGTGSTLQAAVMAGFHAVGIERDPDYQCDIAARLAAYSLAN